MGVFAWIDETSGAVAVLAALGLNLVVLLAAAGAIATGNWTGQSITWRTTVDLEEESHVDPDDMMEDLKG